LANAAASALRGIKRNGQAMTLYRPTLGSYDPVNPAAAVPTVDSSCPAFGLVLPASNGTIEAFDDRILSDPARRQSFRFVILAGSGLTLKPQAEDLLSTAEGVYRLLGATGLNPNGQGFILFNCGCTLDAQLTAAQLTS
jgi:hypothetical protein